MTGRGIDQILPNPSNPHIHEPYVKDAREYVEIAEAKNGPIPKPASFDYVWGDALKHLAKFAIDLRIINLETSITSSGDFWRGKGINYRMNPKNMPCLTTAKIDCCSLANNHVLDWGYAGLKETLESLAEAGVKFAGAGNNLEEAASPAIMRAGTGRVLFFGFGSQTSGVQPSWAATAEMPGVNFMDEQSPREVERVKSIVKRFKRENDLVVVSLHWGPNWGYDVPKEQRMFAHRLIDEAGADLIHGHSSHHPKGIEVYKNKLILYGCGDFLNDYEGIASYEAFRGDLGLMYFVSLNSSSGELSSLRMVPTQIKRFRVNDALIQDENWLRQVLDGECKKLGCHVESGEGFFTLKWS